jgi:hypothetical protein
VCLIDALLPTFGLKVQSDVVIARALTITKRLCVRIGGTWGDIFHVNKPTASRLALSYPKGRVWLGTMYTIQR